MGQSRYAGGFAGRVNPAKQGNVLINIQVSMDC
jgi:hypothetical protein